MQVPEVNYNYRLRSSPAASSENNDAEVNFLVACKVQLSTEVIKWKTETLRLQKEIDNAYHQNKELDEKVLKLIDEVKDLKFRLSHTEDENKYLKTKNIQLNDEKISNIHKLTQSLNKYNSFPTVCNLMDSANIRHSRLEPTLDHQQKYPQNDWQEEAQRLMEKMQQEVKELQSSNLYVSYQKDSEKTSIDLDSESCEEVVNTIATLNSNAKALKNKFLLQRKMLLLLTKNVTREADNSKDLVTKNVDSPILNALSISTSRVRNSQKTFQGHFAEQLEGLQNLQKVKSNDVWKADEDLTLHPGNCSTEQITTSHVIEDQIIPAVEDKICPICQRQFGSSVSQGDFEDHVFTHLEAESASMLEQYVVL